MSEENLSQLSDKELLAELTKTFDAYKQYEEKTEILEQEYKDLIDMVWKRGYTFDDLRAIVGDYYD